MKLGRGAYITSGLECNELQLRAKHVCGVDGVAGHGHVDIPNLHDILRINRRIGIRYTSQPVSAIEQSTSEKSTVSKADTIMSKHTQTKEKVKIDTHHSSTYE